MFVNLHMLWVRCTAPHTCQEKQEKQQQENQEMYSSRTKKRSSKKWRSFSCCCGVVEICDAGAVYRITAQRVHRKRVERGTSPKSSSTRKSETKQECYSSSSLLFLCTAVVLPEKQQWCTTVLVTTAVPLPLQWYNSSISTVVHYRYLSQWYNSSISSTPVQSEEPHRI